MFDIFIAFDVKNRIEYCSYSTVRVRDNKPYHFTVRAEAYEIGSYFLSFINTDFKDKKQFRAFVLEYCFMLLLTELDSSIRGMCEGIKNIDFPFERFFTMEEIEDYIKKLYKKYSKEMEEIRELFIYPVEIIRMPPPNLYKEHNFKFNREITIQNARDELSMLDEFNGDLKLEFDIHSHMNFLFKDQDDEIKYQNIPYGFTSPCFDNIAYISFIQLLTYPNIAITKCFNCNNFFIPKSAHYTKYCDYIYANGKTCKELGAIKNFGESLKRNPVMKKYRDRYISLASGANNYPDNPKVIERYENFKEEGAKKKADFLAGKISAKDFDMWIESTKLSKRDNK